MVAGDDADDAPKTDLSNCDTVELRGEAQCSAVSEVQCSSAVQVDGFRSICLSHARLIVQQSISRRTYSSVSSVDISYLPLTLTLLTLRTTPSIYLLTFTFTWTRLDC